MENWILFVLSSCCLSYVYGELVLESNFYSFGIILSIITKSFIPF